MLRRKIDYSSLEKELEVALKEDDIYQLQNDAKLRAIEQNVPTYEHFRQMVNGAHLKPLEKKDTKNNKQQHSWNYMTAINSSSINKHCSTSNKTINNSIRIDQQFHLNKLPKRTEQFVLNWINYQTNKQKINHLHSVRDSLMEIFRVEIPGELLTEFLKCFLDSLHDENDPVIKQSVVDLLKEFTNCNRFNLTVNFMTDDDKLICSKLFDKLVQYYQGNDDGIEAIVGLARQYGVNLHSNSH